MIRQSSLEPYNGSRDSSTMLTRDFSLRRSVSRLSKPSFILSDPFVEYLVKKDMVRSLQLAQNATFERTVKALMALEAEISRAKKQIKNRDPSLGVELLDYQKGQIDKKV